MRSLRVPALLAVAGLLAAGGARAVEPGAPEDPLAKELARWSTLVKSSPATDEMWTQTRDASAPILLRAEEALRDGRRLLALQRLAAVRAGLCAFTFIEEHGAEDRKSAAVFEAEWERMGQDLKADLAPLSATALDGVRPAAVRALGEAALPQVRGYYEASLEYGRNTQPEVGLYYIGSARAQRDFAALCRSLSVPSDLAPPPMRALGPELDALEGEILAAYRPPASIERHQEFILANSLLKEARELDAAGLRYGALLRLLQASQRFAPVRASAPKEPTAPPSVDGVKAALAALEKRMASGTIDHSLGRLFVEMVESELATSPGTPTPNAVALVSDVLPRYLAAFEPARAPRPKPPAAVLGGAPPHVPPGDAVGSSVAAAVTVTLVRWPYT